MMEYTVKSTISYLEENMNQQRKELIHRINYLMSETEACYHRASRKLGISDSVSRILYTIYDAGEQCLLSDIYKKSGISKQTVNSAIRGLEAENILYLEPYKGLSKRVVLTDRGKEYMQRTAAKLYEAEAAAFDTWTSEEIRTYLSLIEKYRDSLLLQIEKL